MSHCKDSSPAELVASVPGIIGFHPTHSLVGLWTDEEAESVWSIRLDLDTPEPMMARTLLELIDSDDRQGQFLLVAYQSNPKSPDNCHHRCHHRDPNGHFDQCPKRRNSR